MKVVVEFSQNMIFDAESKSVLHTEMAKKNLFVKRGDNENSFQLLNMLFSLITSN